MVKFLLIVAFLASLRFVLLGLARFCDRLVFWTQQVVVVCPKCRRELTSLYFKCPNCNRVYENLTPNFAHIFYVRCACGKRLSTLRVLGRSGAEAVCPRDDCHYLIGPRADELKIVAFPIVGAPASGKTALIMSAIRSLTETIPTERNWGCNIPFYEDARYAARLRRQFAQGVQPDKTSVGIPAAFCVDYKPGALSEPKRLCLYDPAGETFTDRYASDLRKQIYYRYMAGAVVVVDPLALPGLQTRYANALEKTKDSLHVSDEDQNACVDRFLNLLRGREYQTLSDRREENVPCALVLTKTDAFDMERFLGEKAIQAYQKRRRCSRLEATDALCRYWLNQWGGGNIANTLDSQFSVCRCFSASAFGKKSERTLGFRPERVGEPFEWLLNVSGVDSRMGKGGVLLFLFAVVVVPTSICAFFVVREILGALS